MTIPSETFRNGGEHRKTLCRSPSVSVCDGSHQPCGSGNLCQTAGRFGCTCRSGHRFPSGAEYRKCKAFETRDAIAKGATEIDTVINVRALQKGQTDIVKKEIEDMVSICKPAGVICKVILETCYLTDEEKETVCRIAKEAGVDFVKTSTGFGTAGANVHDVALMRRVVGPVIGVKAAGGIRDLDTALALIQVGATRIGTSSGIQIVEAYKELKKGL